MTDKPTSLAEFPPQIIRLIFEHLDNGASEEQYPRVVMQAGLVCKAFRKEVQEMFFSSLELQTSEDITNGLSEDSKKFVRSMKFLNDFEDDETEEPLLTPFDHYQSLASISAVKSTLTGLSLYPEFPGFPCLFTDTLPLVDRLVLGVPVHGKFPFRSISSVLPNVTRLSLITDAMSLPTFMGTSSSQSVEDADLVLRMPRVELLHLAIGTVRGADPMWWQDELPLIQCPETRELTVTFSSGGGKHPRCLTQDEAKQTFLDWLLTMPKLERLLLHVYLKESSFINDPILLNSEDLQNLSQAIATTCPNFKSVEFVLGSSPELDNDYPTSESDSDDGSEDSLDGEDDDESYLNLNFLDHDVLNHPREFVTARWLGTIHPYVDGEKRVLVEVDQLIWPVDPDRVTEDDTDDMEEEEEDDEWEDF